MHPQDIRRAGYVGAVGGALSAISGLAVQGFVQPASDVSDEMWSYPWSSGALVPVSLAYAVLARTASAAGTATSSVPELGTRPRPAW